MGSRERNGMIVRAGTAVVCCAVLCAGPAVRAGEILFPTSPDCIAEPESEVAARAIAAYWFEQGVAQVDRDAFFEAVRSFGCSWAIVPHPNTVYNLARAADWGGEYEIALRAFRLYLEDVPEPENRDEIDAIVIRLIAATETAAEEPGVEEPPAPPREPNARRGLGWASVGLATAGAVVGTLFGGLAAHEQGKIDDAGSDVALEQIRLWESRRDDYYVGMGVGFGIGVAAAVAGALLLVLDDDRTDPPSVEIGPTAMGGSVGLFAVARF